MRKAKKTKKERLLEKTKSAQSISIGKRRNEVTLSKTPWDEDAGKNKGEDGGIQE